MAERRKSHTSLNQFAGVRSIFLMRQSKRLRDSPVKTLVSFDLARVLSRSETTQQFPSREQAPPVSQRSARRGSQHHDVDEGCPKAGVLRGRLRCAASAGRRLYSAIDRGVRKAPRAAIPRRRQESFHQLEDDGVVSVSGKKSRGERGDEAFSPFSTPHGVASKQR